MAASVESDVDRVSKWSHRDGLLDAAAPAGPYLDGRLDHFCLEERRLVRAARDGRLVVVDGATHLVSLVRPDDFAAAVLGAIAELELRAARRRRAKASQDAGRIGTAAP